MATHQLTESIPLVSVKYDCIIVGAGISGLYTAREVLKKHPNWSIAVAEKYKGLGGRTYSYSPPGYEGIVWEMGAGRIHKKKHPLLMDLIHDYGLSFVPISGESMFKANGAAPLEPNLFESLTIPFYINPLRKLSPKILAAYTLEALCIKLYGSAKTAELFAEFPYRAEINTLRADLALSAFSEDGEMGNTEGYGVIAEGFSELIRRMTDELERKGCKLLKKHELLNLSANSDGSTDLVFQFGYTKPRAPHGQVCLRAEKRVVLALHKDAIAQLQPFHGWNILDHLQTQPLLRTYAIFPIQGGSTWFTGLPKVVTAARPRYIIPVNPAKGVIMISYTDGDDTTEYMKIQEEGGDKALEKVILEDIRELFPDTRIPAPKFFRSHPWKTGCTYWTPGNYSPAVLSKEAIHPLPKKLPNVYLCGESWSLRQAWVEGALEHAKLCLERL